MNSCQLCYEGRHVYRLHGTPLPAPTPRRIPHWPHRNSQTVQKESGRRESWWQEGLGQCFLCCWEPQGCCLLSLGIFSFCSFSFLLLLFPFLFLFVDIFQDDISMRQKARHTYTHPPIQNHPNPSRRTPPETYHHTLTLPSLQRRQEEPTQVGPSRQVGRHIWFFSSHFCCCFLLRRGEIRKEVF